MFRCFSSENKQNRDFFFGAEGLSKQELGPLWTPLDPQTRLRCVPSLGLRVVLNLVLDAVCFMCVYMFAGYLLLFRA